VAAPGLEAFGCSPEGRVLAASAGEKLRCWKVR